MKKNYLFKCTVNIIIMFSVVCLGSCGPKTISIDMNGIDLEKAITNGIDDLLTSYPYSDVIVSYEQVPIHTTEQIFQDLVKENVKTDVTLFPTLTYKLTYRFYRWGDKLQAETMAYYAVKDGKLVGVGLISPEKIKQFLIKQQAIGYKAKSTNYQIWILFGFFVLAIVFLNKAIIYLNKAKNKVYVPIENNNEIPSKQKSSNGCALWLPFICFLVCGLIVGVPQEASRGGLIAYLILAILACLFMFGNAMGAHKMGMNKWAKMYWIEEIIWVAITIYIITLLG